MNCEKQVMERFTGLKTLIIGLLLGLSIILLLGAVDGRVGPYQCCAAGTNDVAVFVIDTRDGHTWRLGRSDFYDFGTPAAPLSERTSTVPRVK